ncbi:MAG: hypothetical protein IPN57_11035 [Ignavibacteria bacterium]|nr:hypothetical protein [Ignavibacteria bacterium]MBK9405051.1 hypothetical protein [Ignavibacteria bacterium]
MQEKLNKILIIGIIVICGCGLFDSRSVEPPSEPRSTYLQPTSPDIVITNLNFAIAEKNLDNYLRCFTDSNFSQRRFRYFPDAISLSSYPVFQTWSLTNERNYYSNLISFTNTNSSSNLFLSNTTFNSGIDSAIVDSDYILIFDHNKQNVAKIAKGKLRFIMGVDSRSLWSVHGWYDFINQNNDTTWSVIKANFAN